MSRTAAHTLRLWLFLLVLVPVSLFGRGSIHPQFAMTPQEFRDMVFGLPLEVQARVLRDPSVFLEMTAAVIESGLELTRHVDRTHGLSHLHTPEDLVNLLEQHPGIPVYAADDRLAAPAAMALQKLVDAALQDGVRLAISSAFRDFAMQEELYAEHIVRFGFRATQQLVAPPGHSEHQLGTTVDFFPVGRRFDNTPQDQWLTEHASTFGFSMSYPPGLEDITGYMHESWHYRYIGREAIALRDRFFGGVQFHLTEFLFFHGDFLRETFRADSTVHHTDSQTVITSRRY